MNTLGSRIKIFREKKGITKSELARRIDVSPAYITMLENEKKENPSLEKLDKIATALGISSSILLWDENKFIKDLLSYFQNAYHNNTNHFPKEHEIINILVNNSIISDEKAHIILNNYSNFSSEEIENLISFIEKLDMNVYNQFIENENVKKIRLLGEKISNLRKNNNLSLKELSIKCHLKEFYLKKLEKGFVTYPPEEFLSNIASALNVNADTLTNYESFDFEILFEAMNIGWDYFSGEKDVCIYLANYINVDYKIFEDFRSNKISNFPLNCKKGLLKFISEKSPNKFNKIYTDLIASDLYNLDYEIKDYALQLCTETSNVPEIKESESMDSFLLFLKHKEYPITNLNHETLKYLYEKVNEVLEFEFYKLENKSSNPE